MTGRMDTFNRLQAIQNLRDSSEGESAEDYTDVYDLAREIANSLPVLCLQATGEVVDYVAQKIIELLKSRS